MTCPRVRRCADESGPGSVRSRESSISCRDATSEMPPWLPCEGRRRGVGSRAGGAGEKAPAWSRSSRGLTRRRPAGGQRHWAGAGKALSTRHLPGASRGRRASRGSDKAGTRPYHTNLQCSDRAWWRKVWRGNQQAGAGGGAGTPWGALGGVRRPRNSERLVGKPFQAEFTAWAKEGSMKPHSCPRNLDTPGNSAGRSSSGEAVATGGRTG